MLLLPSSKSGSLITLLFFALFQTSILATPHTFIPGRGLELTPRQQATTSCADYSQIANYSTIGTNSTFRAAFMQASPQGADPTTAILDGATKKLKNLIDDKALNAECGNLTALAIQEAPKNFTLGIVGGFSIKKANAAARVGGGGLDTVALVVVMVAAGLWL